MAKPAPSSEATLARREAEVARDRATAHLQRVTDSLPEAHAVTERLVGHRRANSFGDLFRQAFERRP